jgi:hypothetical protein
MQRRRELWASGDSVSASSRIMNLYPDDDSVADFLQNILILSLIDVASLSHDASISSTHFFMDDASSNNSAQRARMVDVFPVPGGP